MELQYSEQGNNVRIIKLIGALDIMGVNMVDVKFSGYCSGEKPLVLVDLSEVNFIASIGIRLLTSNAKSTNVRGGKLVLVGATPEVKSILEITGIPGVIPMYDKLESTEAVLMG